MDRHDANRTQGIRRLLESAAPRSLSPEEYRRKVQKHYAGAAGWLTAWTGFLTGHESLAGRLFTAQGFDVRGARRILDAGCGNGRYLRFLLREAAPDAVVVGCDFSRAMLAPARARVQSGQAHLVVADITRLPFADRTFDAIVCGWVLEHILDPIAGLVELARVLTPGGKLLVLTTENTLAGAVCSRFYHCRTTSRSELQKQAAAAGLLWRREYWWTRWHRLLGLGGIIVALEKPSDER